MVALVLAVGLHVVAQAASVDSVEGEWLSERGSEAELLVLRRDGAVRWVSAVFEGERVVTRTATGSFAIEGRKVVLQLGERRVVARVDKAGRAIRIGKLELVRRRATPPREVSPLGDHHWGRDGFDEEGEAPRPLPQYQPQRAIKKPRISPLRPFPEKLPK